MEDLKILEQALEVATQKGCFTMNDVFLIKQSLEKLKLEFIPKEILLVDNKEKKE